MPISKKEVSVGPIAKESPCLTANRNTSNYLSLPNAKDSFMGKRRSFTPMHSKSFKTPDLSPIIIDNTEDNKENSPSFNFLVRCKNYKKPIQKTTKSSRRLTMFRIPSPDFSPKKNNSLMEHTLNMKLILQELNMMKYEHLFEAEEINFQVFLTLNDKDMKTIGISTEDTKEMIAYTQNFHTSKNV